MNAPDTRCREEVLNVPCVVDYTLPSSAEGQSVMHYENTQPGERGKVGSCDMLSSQVTEAIIVSWSSNPKVAVALTLKSSLHTQTNSQNLMQLNAAIQCEAELKCSNV